MLGEHCVNDNSIIKNNCYLVCEQVFERVCVCVDILGEN